MRPERSGPSAPRRGLPLRWQAPALLAAVLAAGCGAESGPPRLPVSGRVTLDKKPLDSATITFLPETDGPAASGEVVEGAFRIGSDQGPGAGPYKVSIIATRATGKQVRSPDDPSATIEETQNIVPSHYNARTELRAEVKPGGENDFQFDLVSTPRVARRRR